MSNAQVLVTSSSCESQGEQQVALSTAIFADYNSASLSELDFEPGTTN